MSAACRPGRRPGAAAGGRPRCCPAGPGRSGSRGPRRRPARSPAAAWPRPGPSGTPYLSASRWVALPSRARRGRVELEAAVAHLDLVAVLELGERGLEPPLADGAPRAHHVRPDLHLHDSLLWSGSLPVATTGPADPVFPGSPARRQVRRPAGRAGGRVGRGRRRAGLQRLQRHPTAGSSCGSRPAAQSCGAITTSTSGSTPWFSTSQPESSNQNAYRGWVTACRRPACSARRCRSPRPRCGCRPPGRCPAA